MKIEDDLNSLLKLELHSVWVCNLILTQLERRPQKNLEDHLKIMEKNGRRPKTKMKMEKDLNSCLKS